MLVSKLVQIGFILAPVLGAKFHKIDFDIKKGSKLVDTVHDFIEGVDDMFDVSSKRADDDTHTMNLTNERAFYVSQISIGTPAKKVRVLVDTGSADLWVMSTKNPHCSDNGGSMNCQQYGTYNEDQSSSFKKNDTEFSIHYLDQTYANGTFGQDTVKLNEDFEIEGANFAVADDTDSNVGVFGIAFKKLETSHGRYDNLPVQMKQQGLIDKVAYSLYLTSSERNTGSVLFGGIDHAKHSGDLVKFQIPPHDGQIMYLQIPLSSITVNVDPASESSSSSSSTPTTLKSSLVPHPTIAAVSGQKYQNSSKTESDSNKTIKTNGLNALLDSGTTLSYFSQDIVDEIVNKVDPNASFNSQMGGYQVPCSLRQPGNNITYNFDNKKDIVVPLSDLVLIAGEDHQTGESQCMLGIAQSSYTILGDNFLRHCYSVFNLEDETISIAQMNWNDEDEDIETIE